MNALSQAHRAYSAAAGPTRTSRGIEYEAIAKITHRIRAAEDKGSEGFTRLVEALHDNSKLWSIFAVDVADPHNPLPSELRARLFYLAEFTHQHTSRVLAREATTAPLLDINMAILRGLRSGAA